ncbi:DUF4097 family beta strand repeat-containing protein [Loigolactobacillus backii]|uniref:DUF4097 domain-containing protein n=1 Tax=Loigolactobacillus backii TaxID=375175 RepID=A0A192H214_9LACO|nr:DUF4097 family beta strand repeat-containing protein [Loigolactobacillus backii]ANK60282.1 hypothetical protein AYR52_08500 [Loigolactobacillus backii]ANK62277.1 hypothetical protein AYR53_05495 [Loigolactobacillus backii]ANK65164.1 hypothetical protein AYR54_07910 [Loigolactobacillus backii]ANK67723.1 hypothetical protein AYR55_08515 [Loigolactobacillus backii]ANK70710.1 hypothetical protein AYR56_11495 [Loigolactobacillus backii]
MKRLFKWSALLLLTGTILIVLGLLFGAHKNVGYYAHGFRIIEKTTKTRSLPKINNVLINTKDAAITVKAGNRRQLTTRTIKTGQPQVTVKDGHLTVRVKRTPVAKAKLNFDANDKPVEVILTLPKGELNHLKLSTTSGNIYVKDQTSKNLSATTNNGSLAMKSVKAKQSSQLHSRNGAIRFNTVRLKNSHVITESGEITIVKSQLTKTSLASTSGDIHLRHNKIHGQINLHTNNGSIGVQATPTTGYVIHSSNSKYNDFFGKSFKESLVKNQNTGDTLNLETKNGIVKVIR